jgi:quercetin dioxygenase-like cupin family protein
VQADNEVSFGAGDAGDFDAGGDSSTSPVVKRLGKGKMGAAKKEKKKAEPKAPRVRGEGSGGSSRGGGWERRQTFAKVDGEMKKFRQERAENGTKRSGRVTMPPLKYWANEHVEYKRDLTALPVPAGVVRPLYDPEVAVKRSSTKRSAADKPAAKAKAAKKRKVAAPESSSSESSGASESRIESAVAVQKGTIFSASLDRDEETILAVPMPKLTFYTFPDESGKVSKKVPKMEGCRIAKALELEQFSSGVISIAPKARTTEQDPHESTISFFVVRGTVEVFVYKNRLTLGKGATFFIPSNNCYLLSNPSEKNELVLHYTATNPPQTGDE